MRREIKIGLTGIVALVLLFIGMNFLKGSKIFSTSQPYYIRFPNIKGLTKNSTVYADGFSIGTVGNIIYQGPGKVLVRIDANDGIKIPHGTTATLDEAMLGGCTLNLTMGDNTDCYQPGDTLLGTDVKGLMATVGDVIPSAENVLSNVDSLILALNALATNPNLPIMLDNVRQITENLNTTTQQLDKLMKSDVPHLVATLESAGQNVDTLTANLAKLELQRTMDNLDATISNLNAATQKLTSPDNNIGLLLSDTALYNNLTSTMENASLLLDDIKQHPKRYINVTVFGRKSKDND